MMIVLIVVMMNVVLILEDGDSIGARPKSCHLMIVLIIVMMKKQVILVNSPDRPRSKCCPLCQFGDVNGISDGDGIWLTVFTMVLESYTSIVCDPYNPHLENLLVVGEQFNLYK